MLLHIFVSRTDHSPLYWNSKYFQIFSKMLDPIKTIIDKDKDPCVRAQKLDSCTKHA